jgi:hypothetical protein
MRNMLRFAMDGILSFSLAPLRLAIWMGAIAAGVAVLGLAYAVLMRLFTNTGYLDGRSLSSRARPLEAFSSSFSGC